MYLLVVACIIAVSALAVVIVRRERSFVYIATLVGLICGGFFLAAFFRTAAFILGISLIAGVYLAWLARDELVSGRHWFSAIIVVSVFACVFFSYRGEVSLAAAASCLVLGTLPALVLSYRPRWVRKRGQWESKV